jgi:hypothetical protein
MLHSLAEVNDEIHRFSSQEVTVRCRIVGDPLRGRTGGDKVLYEITDPTGNFELQSLLSFWLEDPSGPSFEDLRRTQQYVIDAFTDSSSDIPRLPRGETLLVRGIPKVADHQEERKLFINITSVVIREPDLRIGKSEIRTQESCPRRYYLRYVKSVFGGTPSLDKYSFRGNAVHLALERALERHHEQFADDEWTVTDAESFADEVMDDEIGIEQAKLSISGIGLGIKENVRRIVADLFTDTQFCEAVGDADSVVPEQPLPEAYGYNGEVDVVADGVPFDLKTSWSLDAEKREKHRDQLRLYLFTLLLERLNVGDGLVEAIDNGIEGYLVYPNLEDADSVALKSVRLSLEDIAELLTDRNEVAESRNAFGPPSTYDRDCDDCSYWHEQPVAASGDELPPACTFHCQNERRWPCYDIDEDAGVHSDCSLFDDYAECEQRLEYRDPQETDHYNALRSALQSERAARTTANDLIQTVSREALIRTGRLVTGLKLAGGGQDALIYEPEKSVVPAFVPGDTVQLEPVGDGETGRDVPYLGRQDGKLLFGFDTLDPAFMQQDCEYQAWHGFDARTVSRRYLPYLDYAERRESHPWFEYEETGDIDEAVTLETADDLPRHLDNRETFVDLPARTDRSRVVATVVETLTECAYPDPRDSSTDVPEAGRRALVLGRTPEQVELAHRATGEGAHYRMDAFASGEGTIHDGLDRPEVEDRLLGSRSLVSSIQYALETSHFHEFVEGGFGDRDHSEKFFDVLVVVGAERVSEPVYLYLRDVADRIVAVGDRRGPGPEMVSTEACDRGLDRSYFERAHDRYATVSVEDAASVQFRGEANAFVQELFRDEPLENHDGNLSFLGIEASDATDTDTITLQASVRARGGVPHDLTFDVTHISTNPFEIQQAFIDREYLDVTQLPSDGSILLDEQPLILVSREPIDEAVAADRHRVTIRADPDAIPTFTQSFLHNRIEARIVSQVAAEYDPAFVVTPFEAHANELKRCFDKQGIDVPVRLPGELTGDIADRAIVSFAAANDAGILHPPLTDPETLYGLLSAAKDLLLVGHEETLRSKDAIERLVTELAEEYVE